MASNYLCWSAKTCRALSPLSQLTLAVTCALAPTSTVRAAAPSLTVSWDPSSGATGYKVFYGSTPGNYSGVMDVGAHTTATIPVTATNQAYYFAVRAYNASGESALSTEVGEWVGVTWRTPTLLNTGDFDGDGRADVFVYRGTTGEWFTRNSSGGSRSLLWGAPTLGDIPVPADYDGDGKVDVAIYRSSTGEWFINKSSGGSAVISWGAPALGDLPVPRDYDGDGKADIAVFRQSSGTWFILQSTTGTGRQVTWGAGTDVPVPGDYDGNGKADLAVYRPSTGQWYILYDNLTTSVSTWGAPAWGDVPVPADYDGDGKTDIGIFRRVNGTWLLHLSKTNTVRTLTWGAAALGDIPVPGDFDGDKQADVAVFRLSTSTWYIAFAKGGSATYQWGASALGDTVGGVQTVGLTQIE